MHQHSIYKDRWNNIVCECGKIFARNVRDRDK